MAKEKMAKENASPDRALRDQLVRLLKSGEAHAPFETAVKDLSFEAQGRVPEGAEHSAWQLLEHLRIAQRDILEFSKDARHESPKWPDGYWPKKPEPPDAKAWAKAAAAYEKDRDAFCAMISDERKDLFAKLPHGDGQTLLREALVLADHNSYHIAQIVLLRRLLGDWKD